MANLIPGICTQCGATLSVDAAKDCMICPYCGTPFIVEKAVQNFNTTYQITNNITAQNVYVQGSTNSGFKIVAGVLEKYTGEAVDVVIPDNVVEIGYQAFYHTMVQSVQIPNSVKVIGSGAFEGCSCLKSVCISDSVVKIDSCAFKDCSRLKYVSIPDSVIAIDICTFSGCRGLENVSIPGGVRIIGNRAFEGCSNLKSISIPNSVKTIGSGAFEDCSNLKSISIPDSVKTIGGEAFKSCTALEKISMPQNIQVEPRYYSGDNGYSYPVKSLFGKCPKLGFIYVDGAKLSIDAPNFPLGLEGSGIYEARIGQENERRKWRNTNRCQYCGGEFKFSFFSGSKCAKCGKERDY